MCAIAGLLYKNGRRDGLNMTTGQALTAMLDATLHRGRFRRLQRLERLERPAEHALRLQTLERSH